MFGKDNKNFNIFYMESSNKVAYIKQCERMYSFGAD